jgi:CBS domain containing-hemolysin-like protein
MTPRGRIRAVDVRAPVLAVIEQARASGHSRFPVRDGSDDFAGVAHVRHAVEVPHERRGTVTVGEIMVPPLAVPASLGLDALLDRLRGGGLHMAFVVDEFGNVDGLVTLEDLVEEIVGEVRDEHDPGEERARREASGRWVLSGLLRPDEVRRLAGVSLPEDDEYETVGGLIPARLERMPQVGDAVRVAAVDAGGVPQAVTLTVLSMDGLRVDRVRLEHEPLPVEDDGEDRE